MHAFLGCDTVSKIYGIGKDEITKSPKLIDICDEVAPVFYNFISDMLEVDEKLLLSLYNRLSIGLLNN